MGLAADRPTLYRTKGPCSFRNPPSTALSRGPQRLDHARSPGVFILERSGRVPYIRLPHGGTEGSNPSPSSGESGANLIFPKIREFAARHAECVFVFGADKRHFRDTCG